MSQTLFISSDCQDILINPLDGDEYILDQIKKGLDIFKWQTVEHITQTDSISTSDYKLVTWHEYIGYRIDTYLKRINKLYRTVNNQWYIVFDSPRQLKIALEKINPTKRYTWKRKYSEEDPGYEVTSRGDRRYSPYFQFYNIEGIGLIKGEDYYQKYIKPARADGTYVPGLGHKLIKDYLYDHPGLIYELAVIGKDRNFTDMFDVNGGQNKWYSEFLNEYYFKDEYKV